MQILLKYCHEKPSIFDTKTQNQPWKQPNQIKRVACVDGTVTYRLPRLLDNPALIEKLSELRCWRPCSLSLVFGVSDLSLLLAFQLIFENKLRHKRSYLHQSEAYSSSLHKKSGKIIFLELSLVSVEFIYWGRKFS